ncbi:MAG: hypothetical protein WB511_06080 [Nitrososphaeraceae archaeon]
MLEPSSLILRSSNYNRMSITTNRSKLTFIVATVLTVIYVPSLLSIFPSTMAENADNMMSENMTAADNMMSENMTAADNMSKTYEDT